VEDQVSSVWILELYLPISDISCDLLAGGPQRSDHCHHRSQFGVIELAH
jgi:hypothetical protein